ncbi:MAG TPA: response regulator [Candidatus Limnocylindria bacterium]|nr:response regulator [Candidatus Limnocylindria bacterium]
MTPTILIVDDEAHMLRVTELSLKRGGYSLLIARNGREAIELAGRMHPALIVMDVQMPEMDGLTALKTLKENEATSHIPVIMLTARGHVLTRTEAEGSGAAMFITKPFSPNQLLADVQRLISAKRPPDAAAAAAA